MNWSVRSRTWYAGLLVAAMAWGCTWPSLAQEGEPAGAAPPAARSPYRQLAPGVMHSIDPFRELRESLSRHDVVELTNYNPNLAEANPTFDWAKEVPFRRDVWCLEFRFKTVRMIQVDVPQASGQMRKQMIWYLIYSVTNHGKAMHPVKQADGTFTVQPVDKPVVFIPEFTLETSEFPNEKPFPKVYPDRVIPVAMGPIRTREDPNRQFLNSVEMCSLVKEGSEEKVRQIRVGETVWGVATWENIDPRIDRFSICLNGLTNAYRWEDTPGSYQPGTFEPGQSLGKGRKFYRKTLRINFWRPGDEWYEHEKEFRYGAPGEVDYEWFYR